MRLVNAPNPSKPTDLAGTFAFRPKKKTIPEIPRLKLMPQERTPTFHQKPCLDPKSKVVRRNVSRASLGPAHTSLYDQVNRAEQ